MEENNFFKSIVDDLNSLETFSVKETEEEKEKDDRRRKK